MDDEKIAALWDSEAMRLIHGDEPFNQSLVEFARLVLAARAIEIGEGSDFETWFRLRYGMTLAEAWTHKRMRTAVSDACDCWATAQARQRHETELAMQRMPS